MTMHRLILLACMLVYPFHSSLAQRPYVELQKRLSAEQMRATGLDTLTKEQLELLNQLLGDDTTKTGKDAVDRASTDSTSPDDLEPSPASDSSANFIGLNEEPIKSRLKGGISGWEPGTVFELENGQQWKVLKGKVKLREPLQSPEIKVMPGFAGRWFLQVVEDMPKARVYRID